MKTQGLPGPSQGKERSLGDCLAEDLIVLWRLQDVKMYQRVFFTKSAHKPLSSHTLSYSHKQKRLFPSIPTPVSPLKPQSDFCY